MLILSCLLHQHPVLLCSNNRQYKSISFAFENNILFSKHLELKPICGTHRVGKPPPTVVFDLVLAQKRFWNWVPKNENEHRRITVQAAHSLLKNPRRASGWWTQLQTHQHWLSATWPRGHVIGAL
jgi:hypothetical protein